MSNHLKRLTSPDSWRIAKKANTFISKTAPGPHNAVAMPIGVWLRDHMGLAQNMKEVKKILHGRLVIVNGLPCKDPKMGIGVFDIISLPSAGKYFRILRARNGNIISVPISEEDSKTRLCKIRNKTIIKGGKIQLNLRYGANVLTDNNSYSPKDSVVLTLEGENRFDITEHFAFTEGNVAMIVGGSHFGKVGRITVIETIPGSISNRVTLEELKGGEIFETIEEYVFMVGSKEPAVAEWGIEQ